MDILPNPVTSAKDGNEDMKQRNDDKNIDPNDHSNFP